MRCWSKGLREALVDQDGCRQSFESPCCHANPEWYALGGCVEPGSGLKAFFLQLFIDFDQIAEGMTANFNELGNLALLPALKNRFHDSDTDFLLVGKR